MREKLAGVGSLERGPLIGRVMIVRQKVPAPA